jgi:hypothetical protein
VSASERSDNPLERLRVELAGARAHGASFEKAWEQALPVALREARWSSEWLDALSATRGAWEIAYGGRGSTRLTAAQEALGLAELMGDGQRPGDAQLVA